MHSTNVKLFPPDEKNSVPECPNLVRNSNAPSSEEFLFRLVLLGWPTERELNTQNFLTFIEDRADCHRPKVNSNNWIAKNLILEATESVRQGGFGISAAIVNNQGEILTIAANNQIQRRNTSDHAEMTVLDRFEAQHGDLIDISVESFTGGRPYPSDLKLVSSAEPCPMCLTRSLIAGVQVEYLAHGGSDGMARNLDSLPDFWRGLTSSISIGQFQANPDFSLMAHLLFYSFLLDPSKSEGSIPFG